MRMKKILTVVFAGILAGSAAAVMLPVLSYSGFAGNINSDREYDSAYASELQKWLACDGAELADLEKCDFNGDGTINIFDLCLMKETLLCNSSEGNIINVSTAEELHNALQNVSAGDTVLLAGGEYEWTRKGTAGSLFMSSAEGTADAPITIKSADKSDPAIMKGAGFSDGMVLYITGDYWNIEDIVFCSARKGIMLDNSNHTTVRNVSVYNIGEEGIHIRDGSSYCSVIGANVHDCGLLTAKYGEGIYIGSANSTTSYSYDCNYNLIQNCTIGPKVSAECVDIKEYTTGNIIENCIMHGGGMTDADSFIDIKGNEVTVRNNIFYDDENTAVADAVQLHCQVEGWGCNNEIRGNTAYLTSETAYFARSWSGTSCSVWNNIRNPESDDFMYRAYNGSTMIIMDPKDS